MATCLLAAALYLLPGAETAQAQTTVKLVSNIGQKTETTTSASLTADIAQAFTTGSNTAGYTLTKVQMRITQTLASAPTYTVTVQSNNSSDQPGGVLTNGTLTNPGSLPRSTGTADFDASGGGIDLAANTTYWVVWDVSAQNSATGGIKITVSDAEDADSAPGWSIGNRGRWRVYNTTSWHFGSTPQIAVHGYAKNNAPTVANPIPDTAALAGTAFSFQFAANAFADEDTDDTFTYTATKSADTALPAWLTFNAGTRTFSGTPATGNIGTLSVKVTASDGTELVSDTFDIAVKASNSAPTVANPIPDQSGRQDRAFSFQFAANAFADTDGDTLTYTATKSDESALPPWLTFTASTRTFSGTPATGNIGTLSVKVTASDGLASVSDTFDIAVAANPTVANPNPDQSATAGRAFSYTFPANTFADADGDTLTYTATKSDDTALPPWLTSRRAPGPSRARRRRATSARCR